MIDRKILASLLLLASALSANASDACDPDQVAVATTPVSAQSPRKLTRTLELGGRTNFAGSIVLTGDSIASQWHKYRERDLPGKDVINYSVAGETTQEMLWRLSHMKENVSSPKTVIVSIGTNNLREQSFEPCGIAAGVTEVAGKLTEIWPDARIFILQILPRGKEFKFREDVRVEINTIVKKALSDSPNIAFLPVDEDAFSCGFDSASCGNYRSDLLHLSDAGYVEIRKALTQASRTKFGRDIFE